MLNVRRMQVRLARGKLSSLRTNEISTAGRPEKRINSAISSLSPMKERMLPHRQPTGNLAV
jgi:hypothetical protein